MNSMTPDKPNISLYEQAKAGLRSLFVQTAEVSIGLIIMLVVTGGNPPGWLVSIGFFLGVGFIAWSENKRQSELNSELEIKEDNVALFILQNNAKIWNFQGRFNFHKIVDLIGADLIGVNLRSANFADFNLSNADLRSANLIDANLRGAYLVGANLDGADLIRANLRSAYLVGANLKSVNLRSADLRSANLVDADLRGAYLVGADLRGAIVNQAKFGNNLGIDDELRQVLIKRGAKFVSSSRDLVLMNYQYAVDLG